MTGPEHYREADELLADDTWRIGSPERDHQVAKAQAHATLALAAATIEPEVLEYVGEPHAAGREWGMVLS